ncbi:MAG: hypothetical protein ACI4N6_04075 [Eubacteriales bacterium]
MGNNFIFWTLLIAAVIVFSITNNGCGCGCGCGCLNNNNNNCGCGCN